MVIEKILKNELKKIEIFFKNKKKLTSRKYIKINKFN